MTTLEETPYLYNPDASPLSTQITSDKDEYDDGELRTLVPEETYGSDADIRNYTQTDLSRIVDKSIAFAEELEEKELGAQALELLNNLQSLISLVPWNGLETHNVPILQPFAIEDGSLLFEWMQPNFRIGFNVEPDPSQSGWYLVSNREIGNIAASGYIDINDLSKLNLWLLNFLIMFSE